MSVAVYQKFEGACPKCGDTEVESEQQLPGDDFHEDLVCRACVYRFRAHLMIEVQPQGAAEAV